jgi:hypothetical protein
MLKYACDDQATFEEKFKVAKKAAPYLEEPVHRFTLLNLKLLDFSPQVLSYMENELRCELPMHQLGMALYMTDKFIGICSKKSKERGKLMGVMINAHKYLANTWSRVDDIVVRATHQTDRKNANGINAIHAIRPSATNIYAPFTGVNLGIMGSFQSWYVADDMVTYSFELPLSRLHPLFSTIKPIPRSMAIYPGALPRDGSIKEVDRYKITFDVDRNDKLEVLNIMQHLGLIKKYELLQRNVNQVPGYNFACELGSNYFMLSAMCRVANVADCTSL